MLDIDLRTLLAIIGLTVITVLARSFFFISEKPWKMPAWLHKGLAYAPIAALAAVISPDIFTNAGVFTNPLTDARAWGAAVSAGFYFWKKGSGLAMPLSIAAGMSAYLPLRLFLGW